MRTEKEWGATLLVAGCSIGAGMLGVPVITGPTGFIPATLAFFLAWGFMVATGLLFVDLLLLSRAEQRTQVHLMSLASAAYGKAGRWVVTLLFAFLFYCVLVAYMLGGGAITQDFLKYCGWVVGEGSAITLFTLLMGIITLLGFRFVDRLNRLLMLGLAVSYVTLLFVALPVVEVSHLTRASWGYMPLCLPVMIIAFGYHNLVPTLVDYLDGDRAALRRAIFRGSAIPLVLYILWEVAILGATPFTTAEEWKVSVASGDIVTKVLSAAPRDASGGVQWLVASAQWFAFFALTTSFLPVTSSFIDFYRTGYRGLTRIAAIFLVLTPPLLFALSYPHFFLKALSAAGGYSAVVLFGLFPALIAHRYYKNHDPWRRKVYLPLIILFALLVLGIEISQSL